MTQWNAPDNDPYRQPTQGYPQGYGPGYAPQDPYARPAYGQPGYVAPVSSDSFGIAGTVLALLGGILAVVAFTAVNWFSGSNTTFGDISDRLGGNANGFATAYFGWLGWVFLVVAVVAGVLSSVPTPALRVFRIVGTVVGFAGAGLTFLAIDLANGTSYSQYIEHARLGFYFAVIGLALAGIGAAIGPRRV